MYKRQPLTCARNLHREHSRRRSPPRTTGLHGKNTFSDDDDDDDDAFGDFDDDDEDTDAGG